MSDDDGFIGMPFPTYVGPDRPTGPAWTTIRCRRCGREGSIPTHELPLDMEPLRDDDGVRLSYCGSCARPNRAQRRKAR